MAVNDELLDASIRRAIFLERTKNGVWRDLRRILRAVERDLVEKIEDGVGASVQSRRYRALLREIREIIEGGAAEFEERLKGVGADLGEIEAAAAVRSLAAASPVAIEWVRPAATLLEATVASKPFQGALLRDWVEEWSQSTLTRVERQITIGIVEGEGIEAIVRRIVGTRANDFADGVLETSRRSARTIVRTYVNHVATTARETVYEANADVIDRVVWVSTLDSRTSVICVSLDGRVYKVGEGPRPPAHPNCRSVIAPITKGHDALRRAGVIRGGSRAARGPNGFTGKVPDEVSFDEWLRRQPEDFQDDVLGPGRAKLFREGLKADRFIDDQNRVLTLDELRAL